MNGAPSRVILIGRRCVPDLAALSVRIYGAWANNRKLYGARKSWHVPGREGDINQFGSWKSKSE